MAKPETNGKQTKSTRFAAGNKIGNRFKKGESGNPNGRPQGAKSVSTILREMLAKIAPTEIAQTKLIKEFCKGSTQITNADAVAARILKASIIDGEGWAIRELLDRLEGKPKQSLDVDLTVTDWREFAEANGLTEEDVFAEAKLLIEQSDNGRSSPARSRSASGD